MADVFLKLEENFRTTMPNLNKVRRVLIPPGARSLEATSDTAFYWETPVADKADDAAEDATRQELMPAGRHPLPLTGNGDSDTPLPQLSVSPLGKYFYFVPTSAGQTITFRASRVP